MTAIDRIPLTFDVREHGVGLVGEATCAYDADCLSDQIADRLAGAHRGDGERSQHAEYCPTRRPGPPAATEHGVGSGTRGQESWGRGVELGRIGIWTSALDRQPAVDVGQADVKIDGLGYGVPWVGEADWQRTLGEA